RSWLDAFQPLERARERYTINTVNTGQWRPEAVLVAYIAAQVAMEIDAPGLNVIFTEFETFERNRDLRNPAVFANRGLDVPDSVPVGIILAALIDHLRIALGSGRICPEHVSVAAIVEGVENNLVVVAGIGGEIFPQVADHHTPS